MTSPDRIAQVDPAGAACPLDEGAVLLDVREPDEWSAEHAPRAFHVPLGRLDPKALPHDRLVVAVCRSGRRSGKAAARLADAGIDVRNLTGGMHAWAADGHPIQRDDGQPGTVL